ncbi:HAD-IIIC family phosphatase [Butyrivibrio hungatei]|uniref:FkbH domain-containing protein n=1 Tax=Butyrivibrio hungatei TaxID=185008 RepID=A0A1D9NZ45_9FIRM|nr:HAD-IIIC family phosphatase [Butyrivibrio hungatei]AOZ95491.1 FkbH domain-containing protein [Butyrivibrio hungatei]
MKELEYPFDADYIISKKKRIKKELLQNTSNFVEKRIAILGGSTTSDITLVLELFLLNNGIKPVFYESEYNQWYQDAMFENAELDAFQPNVIYIYTTNRNIIRYPLISDSEDEIAQLIENEMTKYTSVWKSLAEKYGCPIIQNNFEMPFTRLLGNRDAYDIHGGVNFLSRLNLKFAEYAQEHENFYLCDLDYISGDYGLKKWSDQFYWHMYKYAIAVPAIPYLSFNVANIIKSIFGKNKKGFVLDLDNTLWGGVIGDDGVDNIELGPEESEGQAYTQFQNYLKAHQQIGVILNIDSKNDYENAIAGINHPDSVFKENDFISIKANWNPKDKNFAEIASELNLLPESLVFVDDNPAERHIVTSQLPGVCAPELDDVTHYEEIIDRSGFFEVTTLSKDDLKRNEMYKENAARTKLESSFSDYGEYLQSLEMKGTIRAFETIYMGRIAQLTNKSNQFNLTTKRYTQTEIEQTAVDSNYITLYGKLEDKFGDNGVVSVVIGHVVGDECHIDLWIMSCRVLKRDLEFAMMDTFVKKCQNRGIKNIYGYYYPTKKNHMVVNFYDLQGFKKVSEDETGNTKWILDLTQDYNNKNKYIMVEE